MILNASALKRFYRLKLQLVSAIHDECDVLKLQSRTEIGRGVPSALSFPSRRGTIFVRWISGIWRE